MPHRRYTPEGYIPCMCPRLWKKRPYGTVRHTDGNALKYYKPTPYGKQKGREKRGQSFRKLLLYPTELRGRYARRPLRRGAS